MRAHAHIALVGDQDPSVTAHVAIPKALELANGAAGGSVTWQWVGTDEIAEDTATGFAGFDAVWCVPASPYRNMAGAIAAIRHAREAGKPFLSTCGGYQHAVLEFARNVLGHSRAGNAEVDPECEMPVVGPLTCALVEVSGDISLTPGSRIAAICGGTRVSESYHCSYGVAPEYVSLFDGSDMAFTGKDDLGEPRAFELAGHPFFIGTAYQPERAALEGRAHPLITEFVSTVAALRAQAA